MGGGEPGGEGAAVLLDEVGDGPLHAADDAAVDHDRPVPRAVRPYVVQAEPLGLVEVDLHGGQGGFPARAVGDLDIDLGPVERGLPLGRLVGEPRGVEHLGQQGGGPFPLLGSGHVLAAGAGAGEGEAVAGRGDAQRLVRAADHVQRAPRLLGDLVQGAEDMRVVELDGADAGEPAEHAGRLRAVHAAEFGHAQRQFAVAVRP